VDPSQLIELRDALLRLHKTMLEWERSAYERIHGRLTGYYLLQTIVNDPQFAWLRPLSELIVRIDETLDSELPDTTGGMDAILAQARTLVSPEAAGGGYAERYRAALQDNPDAVVAHRDVVQVLKQKHDASLPSQRPH
jgi:hypothetical protein